MKPYMYLNFSLKIKDWKNLVDPDKITVYNDHNCTLLSEENHEFFKGLGLTPSFAFLWSWKSAKTMAMAYYHTDQRNGKGPSVAINWLLEGDPGITEFESVENLILLNDKGVDPIYGTADTRYFSNKKPTYAAPLRPNIPMLIRVDVPHRVNTVGQNKIRWTYSVRFHENSEHLLGDRAWEIFKKYELL